MQFFNLSNTHSIVVVNSEIKTWSKLLVMQGSASDLVFVSCHDIVSAKSYCHVIYWQNGNFSVLNLLSGSTSLVGMLQKISKWSKKFFQFFS